MARPAGRPNAGKPRSSAGKPRSDAGKSRPGKAADAGKPAARAADDDKPTASKAATSKADEGKPTAGKPTADKTNGGKATASKADDVDPILADTEDDGDTGRTAATDAFWDGVRVDVVEIALPGGAGYTLRAYRMSDEITPADVSGRAPDVELPRHRGVVLDDDELEAAFVEDFEDEEAEEEPARGKGVTGKAADKAGPGKAAGGRGRGRGKADEEDEPDEDADLAAADDADADAEADEDDEIEEPDDADFADEVDEADEDDEEVGEPAVEEVPLFLSQAGHLVVFRSADSLVAFVKSDAEHDLAQLDTWSDVVDGVRTEYVVPLPEDAYELDLVVRNLRGGHDAWDAELVVQSGQLARDLAHALRIEPVVHALAGGSPLDDLDEALRGVLAGGFGSFFARRKVKKIGTETASLGWRTVIGKISAVVDWRD